MRQILIFFIVLMGYTSSFSQNFDWEDILQEDTTIISGQLDNGLRYFIKHNDEPRDRAVLRLVIRTGSLQEEEDQLGVAHFVEHLAFNGTKHFEKNEIINFIERSGSSFGADLNAYTSFDETVYKLLVQTDSLNTLDTALLIMKDWAGALSFDSLEIEAERGVIIAEWRNRLSSRQRIQQEEFDQLLGSSRYGKRFPIGNPELIDTVSRARLLDYYQKWYQPSRMTIIAVGSFDEAWMKTQIESRFSTLPNTNNAQTKDYALSEDSKRSFTIITDPEAAFTRWKIFYQLGRKPQTATTIANIKSDLTYNLYSRMLNGRLVEIKEQAKPTFTFAYAGFSELPANYRSYMLSGFTPKEQLIPSIKTIITESQRAALHGFTQSELDRQKVAYTEGLQQMFKELDKRSSRSITEYIQQSVKQNGYVSDITQMPAVLHKCLNNISLDEIKTIGSSWKNTAITTALITTSEDNVALMPDSLQFYQLIDSLLTNQPTPFIDNTTDAPLVTLKTRVGTSFLVQKDTVLDINEYQLSNGIKIYTKTTDFKNDQIVFTAFSPGGISLYADEDYFSAKHLLAIQGHSGLGAFNKSQLSKKLTGKQIRLSPYIGTYEEGLSGQSNKKDLEVFFQLLYLYFTEARFDSIALENYKIDQQNIFSNIDIDPRSAFGRLVIDLKYQNHLRRPNTVTEEFDEIDLQKVQAIYQERFEDANDFTFLFVGNIPEDSLLLLAEKYLASLPTKIAEESWQDRGLRTSPSPIDTTIIAGQTPKSDVILEWHTDFPFDDINQRYSYYALKKLLNIRLREKLREEMGDIYGLSIYFSAYNQPIKQCRSRIKFNAAPEKVDSLIFYINAAIKAIANGQIKEENISKIQENQLKSYEESLRNNYYWASQIKRKLQTGDSFESLYPGKYESTVEHLNADDLAKAAQRYLMEAIPFKFILMPEEK